MAVGAQGYLIKDVGPEMLFAGIRAAATGGVPLSPRIAAQLMRERAATNTPDLLTERELHVLRMIVAGRSNAEIGAELKLSRASVTSICGRLYKRLGVTDRTQAAIWATSNLPPDP